MSNEHMDSAAVLPGNKSPDPPYGLVETLIAFIDRIEDIRGKYGRSQILEMQLAGWPDFGMNLDTLDILAARARKTPGHPLGLVQVDGEDVWRWQNDFTDPESLTCPVVMDADDLRALLKSRANLDAVFFALGLSYWIGREDQACEHAVEQIRGLKSAVSALKKVEAMGAELEQAVSEYQTLQSYVVEVDAALDHIAHTFDNNPPERNPEDLKHAVRDRHGRTVSALRGFAILEDSDGNGHCDICKGSWLLDHHEEHTDDCVLRGTKS